MLKRLRDQKELSMADSAERQGKVPKGQEGEHQARLIHALDHEMRRLILRAMQESGEPQSPARLATQLRRPVSNVSYHVNVLHRFGALASAGQRQVRGAMEHFYLHTVEGNEPIQTLLRETRESDEDWNQRHR
jgi:Helix-turn-helix domain